MHMNIILILTISIFGFFLVWNSVWIIYKTTLQPHKTRDGTTKSVLRKERTYDQIVKSWKDLLLSVTGCKTWLFHLVTQEGEIKSWYYLNIDGYLKLWQSTPGCISSISYMEYWTSENVVSFFVSWISSLQSWVDFSSFSILAYLR